ncbi:MAG: adenylyltransferase/cytidyltransferase family protein, partial [Thiohalocapsa sp.]
MRSVVYPGTFDPITNGHADLIARASILCDRVVVAVARDIVKQPTFDTDQRVALASTVCADMANVEVVAFSALLVAFARQLQVHV